MGVQERAKKRERVDKDEKIKHLQATILAYSERVNFYGVQVDELYREIDELIEKMDEHLLKKREQETRIKMYETKVGRLRRTIGEYIDKYEKGGNRQIKNK